MFQGALEWSNMGTPALQWDRMELYPPDVSRELNGDSTSAGGKQRHHPVTGIKTTTSKARKVWTKLGNGLYGWRAVQSVGRRIKQSTVNTKPEQGHPSAFSKHQWVPTTGVCMKTIDEIKMGEMKPKVKRKYSSLGGVTVERGQDKLNFGSDSDLEGDYEMRVAKQPKLMDGC